MPLLYFEIFSYPLTVEEIYHFTYESGYSIEELTSYLEQLVEDGYLFRYQGYYLTHDCPEWAEKRIENNARAISFLQKARQYTNIIRHFPFVEGVAISGSLSKNVMPEGGDIDYFIITKPGRLWIARTFLVLFKKVFLLNSHKYFCVNYFVDLDHLKIEEQNRFTATEIATLLPAYNLEVYQAFCHANPWVNRYFPNRKPVQNDWIIENGKSLGRRMAEKLLSGRLGDWLDTFFMNRTIQLWLFKFKDLEKEQFSLAFKSRRYVSKHHPQSFQFRVLKAFESNIQQFEEQHDLLLERSEYP